MCEALGNSGSPMAALWCKKFSMETRKSEFDHGVEGEATTTNQSLVPPRLPHVKVELRVVAVRVEVGDLWNDEHWRIYR